MSLHVAFIAAVLTLFQSGATSPATGQATVLQAGISFNCLVKSNLSSKNSKVGDPVEVETLGDINDGSGKPLMPRGARLSGTVTMVQKRSGDKAALAIRLTDAKWKNGSATLNAVFGGDVMVRDGTYQADTNHLTSRNGGGSDPASMGGLAQVEGYGVPDPKLGTILYAKHDITLNSRYVVAIVTMP